MFPMLPGPCEAAAAPVDDSEVSEDGLLDGRVRLFQPRHGYRVAIDPVLLAAATRGGSGAAVLDAGAGSGAAALCLAVRCPELRITGLERDPALLALARRSVAANGLAERVDLVEGDLLAPPAALRAHSFDAVMTNPPFHPVAAASAPATATRAAAHLATVAPAAWIAACLARLRPGGELTLIHRADALDAILAALMGVAGAVRVCPLWPKAGVPARRVLVAARKGARAPLQLLPGLVLHAADGGFTPAADAILRQGADLPLSA